MTGKENRSNSADSAHFVKKKMATKIINKGDINFYFDIGVFGYTTKTIKGVLKIPCRSIDGEIIWTATQTKLSLSEESVNWLCGKNLLLRIDQYTNLGYYKTSLGIRSIDTEFHFNNGTETTIQGCTRNRINYFFKFTFLDEFGIDFQEIDQRNQMLTECAIFDLCESMEKLLSDNKFSDVTLICRGGNLQAHKLLLASRSEVFERMFRHDMLETQTKSVQCGFEFDVMKALLEYIYIGKISDCNVHELFVAADYYELSKLKNICEQMLLNKISVEKAIATLILAHTYKAEDLSRKALDCIVANAKDIILTDDYVRLAENVSNEEYKEIMQLIVAALAGAV